MGFKKQPLTKDMFVEAIRRRGSDAGDVRDAAHEACHAVDLKIIEGTWDRVTIHEALELRYRETVDQVICEAQARAVEMLICDHFEEPYDLHNWAFISFMETSQRQNTQVPVGFYESSIRLHAKLPKTLKLVEAVLALR